MERVFNSLGVDLSLKGKSFLECTNLFSPNEYKKSNTKVYSKVLKKLQWKKFIVLLTVNIENLLTLKYHIFSKKH